MIWHKPINTTPPHLPCMLRCMQKYDYTTQLKPWKDIILADHLNHFPSCKESLSIAIHQNIQHVQLSNDKLDATRGAVECDPVYNTLYCLTFWGLPDELSIEDGTLLKRDLSLDPTSFLTGPLLIPTAHTRGWRRCSPKPKRQYTGLA